MQVRHLGHVVFYVRDLQRSLAFYRDLLGLKSLGETFNGRACMLTSGRTHHELLLLEVGDAPAPPPGRRIGLYHVGWCIGDSDDALRDAKAKLEAAGVAIEGMSDHWISHSLYLRDPDGNELELYVDVPDYDWHSRTEWIDQPVKPLEL
ncbi:VOC family protein [Thiosocius teredinicola]|uniref:VOC family protein n=1 Tax=Thiosocius teredinicola TaxID=1973002 RepID=UPI00099137D7